MEELSLMVAMGTALWLGIQTSISPCPLASNIAAVSYISKQSTHPKAVLISGGFYTLGRLIAYIAVSFVVTTSLLSMPVLSQFLQKYINMVLWPVLIITALFLFEIISFNKGGGISKEMHERIHGLGIWTPLAMGILFALAFCPVSAALYFGGLIPLSVSHRSSLVLPLLFGVGTAIPVVAFAIVMSISVHLVGKFFHHLTKIEIWIRRITAVAFIVAGIYMTLKYSFNIIA